MKNIFYHLTFSLILLFSSTFLSAQKLSITDGIITYDDQDRPCIVVQIEPDTKDVKDAIKDWMDDEKDVKLRGFGFLVNKDVLTAKEIKLPEISPNEMDFYVEVLEKEEITEMKVFGSFGYNIHISKAKYPTEYRALKNMTLDFLSNYLPEYYKNKIEDTQELLSDLKEERENLKEDIEENSEEIVELKEENIELNGEVSDKNIKVEKTSIKLQEQKTKLKKINEKLKIKEN